MKIAIVSDLHLGDATCKLIQDATTSKTYERRRLKEHKEPRRFRGSQPPEWVVHGSDFSVPIDGWAQLPFMNHGVNTDELIEIARTKNPLDRDVRVKRVYGFSDSIPSNAERVLRIGYGNSNAEVTTVI